MKSSTLKSKNRNFDDCPCSGKNLAKLVQPSILAFLREGPAHGYALSESIDSLYDFPGGAPRKSAVYQLLKRMESEGLIASHLEATSSGPARRVYQITPDGGACLARWRESLSLYRKAVDKFLDLGSS